MTVADAYRRASSASLGVDDEAHVLAGRALVQQAQIVAVAREIRAPGDDEAPARGQRVDQHVDALVREQATDEQRERLGILAPGPVAVDVDAAPDDARARRRPARRREARDLEEAAEEVVQPEPAAERHPVGAEVRDEHRLAAEAAAQRQQLRHQARRSERRARRPRRRRHARATATAPAGRPRAPPASDSGAGGMTARTRAGQGSFPKPCSARSGRPSARARAPPPAPSAPPRRPSADTATRARTRPTACS